MKHLQRDFAACLNKTCPSADKCLRQRPDPTNHWQAFANFSYDDSGRCESFIPVTSSRPASDANHKVDNPST